MYLKQPNKQEALSSLKSTKFEVSLNLDSLKIWFLKYWLICSTHSSQKWSETFWLTEVFCSID